MAFFYPPPPPFIGARQPYAPHLGLPQSGPLPSQPPPLGRLSYQIIDGVWRLDPVTVISLASFAGLQSTATNGPWFNPSLSIIRSAWHQQPYPVTWQRPMADLIPAAAVASQPPPISKVIYRLLVEANHPQRYQIPHPPSAVPSQPIVTGVDVSAALCTRGFGRSSTITNLTLRFFDIAPGNVPVGTLGRLGIRSITGRFT